MKQGRKAKVLVSTACGLSSVNGNMEGVAFFPRQSQNLSQDFWLHLSILREQPLVQWGALKF